MNASDALMSTPPFESRGSTLLGLTWTFSLAAIVVCLLRIYVRRSYTGKLGADDYWILATAVSSFVFSIVLTVRVSDGLGTHVQYAEQKSSAQTLAVMSIVQSFVGTIETTLLKLSITSFLLRLRPGRRYQVVIWFTLASVLAISVFTIIALVGECQPLSKLWDPMEEGWCWSQSVMIDSYYAISVVCTFAWLVYIILPICYTWDLQIPVYTKRAIWCLLGLGLVPAVSSVMKIPYTVDFFDPDVTWTSTNYYIAFIIEMNTGIVVASIPPIKPLIDTRWPRLLTGSSYSSSSGKSTRRLGAFERMQFGKNVSSTPAGISSTGGPAMCERSTPSQDETTGTDFV